MTVSPEVFSFLFVLYISGSTADPTANLTIPQQSPNSVAVSSIMTPTSAAVWSDVILFTPWPCRVSPSVKTLGSSLFHFLRWGSMWHIGHFETKKKTEGGFSLLSGAIYYWCCKESFRRELGFVAQKMVLAYPETPTRSWRRYRWIWLWFHSWLHELRIMLKL